MDEETLEKYEKMVIKHGKPTGFPCEKCDEINALKKQILDDAETVERIKELDLEYIIQILKEYGFAVCSTSECRNKLADQHDKLLKLLKGKP